MQKIKLYKYIGLNGTIVSHVLLEDAVYIPFFELTADENKILTNGSRYVKNIIVNELDLPYWKEIQA